MTYTKGQGPRNIKHHELMGNDFETGRAAAKFSDLMLVSADGAEFPAHKFVLSALSPVIDRMFTSDQFVESKNNRVEIEDISSEVMKPFLAYLYSGDTTSVKDCALELLEIAHKVWVGSLGPNLGTLIMTLFLTQSFQSCHTVRCQTFGRRMHCPTVHPHSGGECRQVAVLLGSVRVD